MKPVYRSGEVGFTLIELIISITVLIMLAMLGVPSLLNLIRDARLSAQADLFSTALSTARIEAIKQRKDFKVCPSNSGATACSTSASDWGKGLLIWDGAAIFKVVPIADSTTIASAATEVMFRGTLGSATAAASFTICASGRKQQQVDVTLSGHVMKRINTATVCP
ncbi:hypothetical protein GBK02_00780 [Dechloromonas sp. TW-R-39-2]|uniref:GspH/FimT family pseudopilin n=1 Tax=Dechloromonas sp. TW-R-39-2 TaxID=2654218 RepID=UPI00193E3559|nr:GspH/FimT family pseudopilin [Dechloromonas sp. TW-R-39-2]QRM18027.1 hypothetical protein GBK02_00780 [Dechloromonas sp. TW-R-39-2]